MKPRQIISSAADCTKTEIKRIMNGVSSNLSKYILISPCIHAISIAAPFIPMPIR